ncbi:unnamed protein product [Peronospora belbahrii]|uniref:SURP motif domain-containing protein n=1 Tax=Peronospora belbahrii TaxID=622444 RepID=A0AAU9L6N5_9STRA|nr:unnamed protein product [Peronospora belbahrii]CAH0517585.1 unnamed protein product [Peronospora belbahrii]
MTPPPMSSTQLEQQFQARIAQAKEAARLASIAAAARGANGLINAPFTSTIAIPPGAPFHPVASMSSHFQCSKSFSTEENVPMDVKTRIDRLVEFVARNGDAFEATAREREQDNPDFAFLRPGGPFSAYYQWKKQQMCRQVPPGGVSALSVQSKASLDSSNGAVSTGLGTNDPLGAMSVGAMANVCKYARASGVQTYAPIPREVMMNVGNLPPVEPARLEIRMSEFYRHEKRKSRQD